jgi:GT2 family glycosyltransferase
MLTLSDTAAPPTPLGARLANGVTLLAWQDSSPGAAFRPRLGAAALARPYAAVTLDDVSLRRAALVRLPDNAAPDALLAIDAARRQAPALALDAITTLPALTAALDAPSQARLLGFLLDVGGGLFGLAPHRDFAAACLHIARTLHDPARIARPVAALPGGRVLVELPDPVGDGAWHVLHACGVKRAVAITTERGALLVLGGVPAGALLHQAGSASGPWQIGPASPALPHALAWLESRPELAPSVARLLHATPALAPLLHELALLAPRPARRHDGPNLAVAAALELALPDGHGGLFLRGWLRDPRGLVAGMTLVGPHGEAAIAPDRVFRTPRPDLARRFSRAAHAGDPPEGFVLHLPDVGADLPQPELQLRLASGAPVVLVPPLRTLAPAAARDAVLGSVPPEAVTPAMMAHCLAPAAARLHAAALVVPRVTEIVRFGTPPARPRFSVLIPLYRNLSFLRAQFAAFACDPGWREAETILVLDSPEQRAEVEHFLRGIHLMHGVPATLVVMPRNLGYAAANNAGAAVARGRFLLLLNSDVVPDAPGWLARLAAPLVADRKLGATGPKLLFEDSSIQHAGLLFARDDTGTWFNRHYFKGFPRHFAPACRARAVPGVTGAALLVRKKLFETVGGLTEHYIIGDYEDSDFCLKLRDAGAGIAYVPEAELWHFERRSIRLHTGYARTLASNYNRQLHHARWDGAIGALMRAFSA